MNNQLTTKSLFDRVDVKQKFTDLLGKRATSFITSVLQIVTSSDKLVKADPMTVYNSAAVAATLDLPLNNSLGFAYIVPFNNKKADKVEAQFQIGYKGLIQLGQRSGQYKSINVTDVREGEIKSHDRLTDLVVFEWCQDPEERAKRKVIAYVAYFSLINGFEKINLMYISELEAHAKRFSQTYKMNFGLWKDDFDSMSRKTVLKLLISKYGPMSVDMQTALIADQSVIKDTETLDVSYVDNGEEVALTNDDLKELYELKKESLTKEEQTNAERILNNKEEASYNKLHKQLQSK